MSGFRLFSGVTTIAELTENMSLDAEWVHCSPGPPVHKVLCAGSLTSAVRGIIRRYA